MQIIENLGEFYLGREYDLATKTASDEALYYESKDLLTHAVCVGMTGSGKTGLCVGLLEEAAIDGIPAIVIDPKGDLSNLLLTFPNLSADDFRPWINEDEARTQGLTPETFAAQQAALWQKGLDKWGQDGARIQRLRDAADFAVYTPGSTAGIPVSVLRSFDAPDVAIREDREAFNEQVNSTVTSLLGLLKINADPVQSREHILLANLLSAAWREGRNLDIPNLILQIQKPPMQRFGVMDVDTFYPEKERFQLAMAINNLIASPGFELWMEGEPLEVSRFLHTPQGKPRIAIFSIAHLNDSERMFFVSMLLNQVLSWMRRQSGTTSLRALLYMDEIFGYFPPVANPPSKGPLLTLLKQARAFGLGVVLSTQNPVDLDYKGLSNCGTWFIGRLQTENDKARVMEGLEGASLSSGGAFDRATMDRILSGVGKRVFLLHNVHESAPTVFETRWVMSYLRGPMTRSQIVTLMETRKGESPSTATGPTTGAAPPPPPSPGLAQAAAAVRPSLPSGVTDYFLPIATANAQRYEPVLVAFADVHYARANPPVDETRGIACMVPFEEGPIPIRWESAEAIAIAARDLEADPQPGLRFMPPPSALNDARSIREWEKDFAQYVYTSMPLTLYRSKALGEVSKPGESERDFRIHLQQVAREQRDTEVAKIREKYGDRVARVEERIFAAQQKLEKERADVRNAQVDVFSMAGGALLGAVFGRGGLSTALRKGQSAARRYGKSQKEEQDVALAEEKMEQLMAQRADLLAELEAEVDKITDRLDPLMEELEDLAIKPKKSDIQVRLVTLAWRAVV